MIMDLLNEEDKLDFARFRDSDEEAWRGAIRRQMEEELNRRVREALETPPLERGHRQQDMDPEDLEDLENLNAHVHRDLTQPEADYVKSRKWKILEAKRKMRKLMAERQLEFDPVTSQQIHMDLLLGEGSTADDLLSGLGLLSGHPTKSLEYYAKISAKAFDNFGTMSQSEKREFFYAFTQNGFREAMKTGKLLDGTELKYIGNGKYMDIHGIVRDEHGPFWPLDYGPLHPAPIHKRALGRKVEPLTFNLPDRIIQTVDNQHTQFVGRWRGVQMVYDLERSPKNYPSPSVPEGVCPSLTFESRFECGNLRQVRRTGQYDYELLLKTDLYTKRHTQWYYFRVRNAVPGITYRFRIINLLKRDSLYNHGMRPLFYSERAAQTKSSGWVRSGHHISYFRNSHHLQSPLLTRENNYYVLEWQMEFPHANDTCYLAHCYPYSYTDLKDDLDTLQADATRSQVMKREVMCETRAGNSCFLVTVTNFDENYTKKRKKWVVVSGRVHPGESNASWMVKGLLDFLTGNSTEANELRKHYVFKVVPMLNPDGVIVGNYRCSLAARDLNRNYRHPRKENFPTIWHTKDMMENLSRCGDVGENTIVLYCDMHGHSRKQNVFMYGCNSSSSPGGTTSPSQAFLNERLFPWLMAKKAPDKFSFTGCKFQVRRCKEATGRVVMFRQMRILNSFTMEATFCGTTICKGEKRHFGIMDFQHMGRIFGEAVLEYHCTQQDREKQSETVVDLTRVVTHQILESRGVLPGGLPDIMTEEGQEQLADMAPKSASDMSVVEKANLVFMNLLQKHTETTGGKDGTASKDGVEQQSLEQLSHLDGSCSASSKVLDGCMKILDQLNVHEAIMESDLEEEEESSSSDSDSESEPELKWVEPKTKRKKKRLKKKKDSSTDLCKSNKSEKQRPKSSVRFTDGEDETRQKHNKQTASLAKLGTKCAKTYPGFVNKYEGRSNGGIPCFSEERLMERATKRMAEMKRRLDRPTTLESTLYGGFDLDPSQFDHDPSQPCHDDKQLVKINTQMDLRSQFLQALQGGTPMHIRTGYSHGDGDLPQREPPSSSDPESSDELPQHVSIATLSSPYHNTAPPLMLHPHVPSYTLSAHLHQGGVVRPHLSALERPARLTSGSIRKRYQRPSQSMMISSASSLHLGHSDWTGSSVPIGAPLRSTPRTQPALMLQTVQNTDTSAYKRVLGSSEAKLHPAPSLLSRQYTDLLLHKLRNHKTTTFSTHPFLDSSGARPREPRHSTCE